MSKESRVRITFVRHGESVANRSQRWQGQGDSELSELGRAQARAFGQRIRSRSFDRVISSDLVRAAETCRASGFAFESDPTWREFDVGRWEGLTREEVEERYPEELERLKYGEDIPLGGGESHSTFAKRIDGALAKLRSELSAGQHALVVCHGGVISTLIAGALGLRNRGRWPLSRVCNTAISELSFDAQGNATMHVFNDTLHVSSVCPWPSYEETTSCVALVSETAPCAEYGSFHAHYHAHEAFAEALRENDPEALSAVLFRLGEQHREQRIALSARAALIRAWAEDTLWLGAARLGSIVAPPEGTLAHVGYVAGRPALFDYGVRPE